MVSSQDQYHDLVQEILGKCGLEINEPALDQLCQYLRLLEKWNKQLNLTGLTSRSSLIQNLFAESFIGAERLGPNDFPCLDVGSGSGFPGMAMKIYRPELKMILLEPRQKRANFLSTVKRELGLKGVEVLVCRLEDVRAEVVKNSPVVYISRGLGNQKELLEIARGIFPGLRRILLFTTIELSENLRRAMRSVHWNEPIAVPWNRHHVLLEGEWGVGSEIPTEY